MCCCALDLFESWKQKEVNELFCLRRVVDRLSKRRRWYFGHRPREYAPFLLPPKISNFTRLYTTWAAFFKKILFNLRHTVLQTMIEYNQASCSLGASSFEVPFSLRILTNTGYPTAPCSVCVCVSERHLCNHRVSLPSLQPDQPPRTWWLCPPRGNILRRSQAGGTACSCHESLPSLHQTRQHFVVLNK